MHVNIHRSITSLTHPSVTTERYGVVGGVGGAGVAGRAGARTSEEMMRRNGLVYLQTVMRFLRSTQTLRVDAFFDVSPIAISVGMETDAFHQRVRSPTESRRCTRTPPSSAALDRRINIRCPLRGREEMLRRGQEEEEEGIRPTT